MFRYTIIHKKKILWKKRACSNAGQHFCPGRRVFNAETWVCFPEQNGRQIDSMDPSRLGRRFKRHTRHRRRSVGRGKQEGDWTFAIIPFLLVRHSAHNNNNVNRNLSHFIMRGACFMGCCCVRILPSFDHHLNWPHQPPPRRFSSVSCLCSYGVDLLWARPSISTTYTYFLPFFKLNNTIS